MPAEDITRSSVVVTGSSGFIGAHLCASLRQQGGGREKFCGIDVAPPREQAYSHIGADIGQLEQMRPISLSLRPVRLLIHLAASAEVLMPWGETASLLSNNIRGTYNVLEAFNPRLMVFASSSSLYGSAPLSETDPSSSGISPLCLYASSKGTGEMIARDWARASGNAAMAMRLGNVIGRNCRGLIPYLIGHIQQYPDGAVPAQLRGGGRLIRDYVPVSHVVRTILAAGENSGDPGALLVFNIGTGRGVSNREVASIVSRVAAGHGFRLEINYDNPLGPGEASQVVLDVQSTTRRFGILPPGPEEVVAAIEDAARHYLQSLCVCS